MTRNFFVPVMQKVVGKNVFVELSINMCLLLASYCCSANDHKHGDLEQMTTNTAAERAPSFSESFGGMKHEMKTLARLVPSEGARELGISLCFQLPRPLDFLCLQSLPVSSTLQGCPSYGCCQMLNLLEAAQPVTRWQNGYTGSVSLWESRHSVHNTLYTDLPFHL